ncbi:MAG TPA: PEP-CTERM sorting domain-containing protein [Candidatus Brocadiia bacterium]|nr:PEP-CTERM sorting domain-containing protein [Candidatus Brocadiia bacterium]
MKKILAFLALLLIVSSSLRAAVIISNHPGNDLETGTSIALIGGGLAKAAGFTMPAGSPYSLDSVTMRWDVQDTTALITVQLFGDIGGNPGGAPLADFLVPALSLGVSDQVLVPTSSFTLMPSTTYWIAAIGTATYSTVNWIGSDPSVLPTGPATSAGYRFDGTGIFPPTGPSAIYNTYEVSGTPVPEPGSIALVGFGIIALAIRCRQSQK